jgi:hypothetical protein
VSWLEETRILFTVFRELFESPLDSKHLVLTIGPFNSSGTVRELEISGRNCKLNGGIDFRADIIELSLIAFGTLGTLDCIIDGKFVGSCSNVGLDLVF